MSVSKAGNIIYTKLAATTAVTNLVGTKIRPMKAANADAYPYIIYDSAKTALPISIITTLSALAIFGALKGAYTGIGKFKSALQTTSIGGLAAGVAFFVAKLLS